MASITCRRTSHNPTSVRPDDHFLGFAAVSSSLHKLILQIVTSFNATRSSSTDELDVRLVLLGTARDVPTSTSKADVKAAEVLYSVARQRNLAQGGANVNPAGIGSTTADCLDAFRHCNTNETLSAVVESGTVPIGLVLIAAQWLGLPASVKDGSRVLSDEQR